MQKIINTNYLLKKLKEKLEKMKLLLKITKINILKIKNKLPQINKVYLKNNYE